MRVSIVPHCTQVWVTSSRSFDSTPLAYREGVTDVIAIRCPQCGQGRRKLGRRDEETSLHCMELSSVPAVSFLSQIKKLSTNVCASHKLCASQHRLVAVPLSGGRWGARGLNGGAGGVVPTSRPREFFLGAKQVPVAALGHPFGAREMTFEGAAGVVCAAPVHDALCAGLRFPGCLCRRRFAPCGCFARLRGFSC